jgi:hypothetical protein
VWLEPKAENVFTFDAATKPMLVNFDYEGTWLKEMKFDKSVDELLYQMKNDKDVLGRRLAMNELSKKAKAGTEKDRIVSALIESGRKRRVLAYSTSGRDRDRRHLLARSSAGSDAASCHAAGEC